MQSKPRRKSVLYWTKRIGGLFLLVLLLLVVLFFLQIQIQSPEVDESILDRERIETPSGDYQLGSNFARKSNHGFYEVYIEGEAFERGVAYGKLLAEPIERQEDHFVGQVEKLVPSAIWRNTLKYLIAFFNSELPEYIPYEYQKEVYGVSRSFPDKYDHIGPKYYRILNYHAAHDIGHALQEYNMVGCTSFALKDAYTEGGGLLIGRNFDFYLGDEFAEDKVLTVVRPDSGYQLAMFSWAGLMGVVSGMNEVGLTVTINAAKSALPTGAKDPISLLAREILQYASTIEEANAIAQKREVFVSESILVGSAKEHRAAIIEKAPHQMGQYDPSSPVLLCSNHYQSEPFLHDSVNILNKRFSDSFHRYKRTSDLVEASKPLSPAGASQILRDVLDTNERFVGWGNPKSINQFIAHHSVTFQPEKGLMWISAPPYQLGTYICYDLNRIFKAENPSLGQSWTDSTQTIAADSLGFSDEFLNFQQVWKPIKKQIFDYTRIGIPFVLTADLEAKFIAANEESYITYMTLGEYYQEREEFEKAVGFFHQALTKSVASEEEERIIKGNLAACERELNQ